MDAIRSTVNFEDLFDLSPEPVDRASNAATNAKHRAPDNNEDVFADFDAVLAGHLLPERHPEQQQQQRLHQHHLSASVPSNWSGGGSTPSSSAGDATSTNKGGAFTVGSVGQLLDDLPEPGSSVPVVTKSKRGRKPGQRSLRTDMKTKLERSRQSARECRARKKLRYQYLDDLILEREKANELLREELLRFQKWCYEIDKGRIPEGLQEALQEGKD